MPLVWTFLAVLGLILLWALSLLAFALFSPLVFTIDSEMGRMSIRWLAALEYRRPLPWVRGEARLSIAGKAIGLPARKRKRQAPQPPVSRRRPQRNLAAVARFLRRCLGEPAIRRVLAKRLGALGRGMLRSVVITCRRISVSLPDPAWNGMMAGWLAWRGAKRSAVQVNFRGENELFLEVRLCPYRIVKALLVFSVGLPYRALWREWRAASAVVPG